MSQKGRVARAKVLWTNALFLYLPDGRETDFVTHLIAFAIVLLNAGLSEGGLLAHLSEAVRLTRLSFSPFSSSPLSQWFPYFRFLFCFGLVFFLWVSGYAQVAEGLSGIGHSTAYSSTAAYDLSLRYLFETTPTMGPHSNVIPAAAAAAASTDHSCSTTTLVVEEFLASQETTSNAYEIPWIWYVIHGFRVTESFFPRAMSLYSSDGGSAKLLSILFHWYSSCPIHPFPNTL